MRKRHLKKLHKKLIKAIRALNEDIAQSEGLPFITEAEVNEALVRVKESRNGVAYTLKDYKNLLNQKTTSCF